MLEKYKKKRLSALNIKGYLSDDDSTTSISLTKQLTLSNFKALLQKDYGGLGDCTLTSMTASILWELPGTNIQEIYDEVERNAKKFLYNEKKGTFPLFIKAIYNRSRKFFGLSDNTKAKYIKGLCWNFNDVVNIVNSNKPVILSINNDGRNYYKNHTITIIGYAVYNVKGTERHILQVYDNWVKAISLIDYDILPAWSCINF